MPIFLIFTVIIAVLIINASFIYADYGNFLRKCRKNEQKEAILGMPPSIPADFRNVCVAEAQTSMK